MFVQNEKMIFMTNKIELNWIELKLNWIEIELNLIEYVLPYSWKQTWYA